MNTGKIVVFFCITKLVVCSKKREPRGRGGFLSRNSRGIVNLRKCRSSIGYPLFVVGGLPIEFGNSCNSDSGNSTFSECDTPDRNKSCVFFNGFAKFVGHYVLEPCLTMSPSSSSSAPRVRPHHSSRPRRRQNLRENPEFELDRTKKRSQGRFAT